MEGATRGAVNADALDARAKTATRAEGLNKTFIVDLRLFDLVPNWQ